MLPESYRLHRRADFSRTVRRGRRSGRRDLVVHAYVHESHRTDDDIVIRRGGPHFGLIVSKAVGSAVVRHRVARRLRHVCAELCTELPADADIVIRALPGSAVAESDELRHQLRGCLRKLGMAAGRTG